MSRILLPRRVLNALEDQRRTAHPLETGGFLQGIRRGDDIEVTDFTAAEPGDKATRTSFERRSRHHQTKLSSSWRKSDGVVSLVGDWHSHPAGTGTPSRTDLRAWAKLLRAIRLDGAALILTQNRIRVFWLKKRFRTVTITELQMVYQNSVDLVFGLETGTDQKQPTLEA
ncbi:MAG: Mov34/MPN/PAD-1 family protein [Pseudomonadota bacterium]